MSKRRPGPAIDRAVAIETFGNQADLVLVKPSQAVFKRYNFSLTKTVSADINTLSDKCIGRISRSDIVKAGIEALKEMHEEDFKCLINDVISG
jgi:predicted transcriptional regulator